MKLTDRAETVAKLRIFMKDAEGNCIEDFDGMCHRVAKHLANSEEEEKDFFWVMNNLLFLPNSPCLVNAGAKGRKNQLSGCFVLGVDDSIEAIFDTIKETALIHKTGGGTGFSFSKIRPKDSSVSTTNGVASGPVSFMRVFDAATEGIKQGGVRRGANMGCLRVDHPDIMEFISCKQGKNALQNFNISVSVTDSFMEAVLKGEEHYLINPNTKERTPVSAKAIWESIVSNAWNSADPGVLFIDRINEHNPLTGIHSIIESTNPCGEVPLSNGEACGLGSINLSEVIKNYGIDYDKLKKITRIAVILLNRMMRKSEYPNKKIADRVLASCKIGLGVMGFADMLIKMRIPYSSQDAQEMAESISQVILDTCVKTTHELGLKEGVFPLFKAEYKMPGHIKDSLKRLKIKPNEYRPANSALLAIAPTGTISIIANCSSGIEPIFHFEQTERRVDMEIVHTHPLYAAYKEKFPKCDMPHYFQELKDVDIDTHVYIQATFQKYICGAVSKTVNLPNDATKQDVEKVYREAFILGCKGVTVYRDGCLDNQVISGKDSKGNSSSVEILPKARPEVLSGMTYQIKTGFGEMLVTVNYNEGKPFEIVCQLGKSGASEAAKAEAVSRLCSIMLRSGIPAKVIVEQLEGIVGSESVYTKYGLVTSIPDALSKILINHVLSKEEYVANSPTLVKCPDCGRINTMLKEGSCATCTICGYKSCGS